MLQSRMRCHIHTRKRAPVGAMPDQAYEQKGLGSCGKAATNRLSQEQEELMTGQGTLGVSRQQLARRHRAFAIGDVGVKASQQDGPEGRPAASCCCRLDSTTGLFKEHCLPGTGKAAQQVAVRVVTISSTKELAAERALLPNEVGANTALAA